MKKIASPLFTFALLAFIPCANAQISDGGSTSGNTANVGAIALYSSEYLGSGDEEFTALPFIDVDNYKGFDFFGTTLSYRALETGTGEGLGFWSLRVGPSLSFLPGRNSSDSETLTGLEDVDGSLLAGGYIRSTIGPVGFRLDAGQDVIGGSDGLTAIASVGTSLPFGKLSFRPSASAFYGSSNFNEAFFGIDAEQSAASGLAENDVSSGIYSYSVNLVGYYPITDKWRADFVGSYRWFTDEADDSPIITAADGSDNGLFVGFGFTRQFNLP